LSAPVRYGELARVLGTGDGGRAPLADVRSAVLALRRGKGMVLDPADPDTRSAGSFFTNPVLDSGQLADVRRRAAAAAGVAAGEVIVPHFPAGDGQDGQVKVPAAWLIEHAGFGKETRAAAVPVSRPSTPWRSSTAAAPAAPAWSRWRGRSGTACGRPSGLSWSTSRC